MIATRARTTVLIAASCLLLTGCGPAKSALGGRPAATPTVGASARATAAAAAAGRGNGAGLTACNLITAKDASTAIGAAVRDGTAGGSAALSECIYSDGGLIVSMKTDSLDLYNTSRTSAIAKGATDVPGVGDSAFAAGTDDYCTMLLVKGTTLVSILFSGTDAHDVAVKIAKVAASKI
jgi:hypothetical protein